MSRTGYSSANFLKLSAAPVTAVPLTLAGWGRLSALGSARYIIAVQNSAVGGFFSNFSLGSSSGNAAEAFTNDGSGGFGNPVSTTTVAVANTWAHYAGVWTSATLRAAYLNGGGKATNATSVIPASINSIVIGDLHNTGSNGPWSGDLAHVAVWSAALSDGEILRLAGGIAPIAVRRESLIGYWPLAGGGANEVNVTNPGQPMVLNGALTLSAPPPKFFMPVLSPTRRRTVL